MGFNKRFVNRKTLSICWKQGGKDGIIKYFENCDAIILNSDSYDIWELYKKHNFVEIEKLLLNK